MYTSPCLLLFVCACVCVNGNPVYCSKFSKCISKFFSGWPSHLARLALLFLSGCALSFCNFLSLVFMSTLCNFRARIKIVVVVVVVVVHLRPRVVPKP